MSESQTIFQILLSRAKAHISEAVAAAERLSPEEGAERLLLAVPLWYEAADVYKEESNLHVRQNMKKALIEFNAFRTNSLDTIRAIARREISKEMGPSKDMN
jgi:hypothetical protein